MIKRLFIVIITPIFFLLAAHFIIPYIGAKGSIFLQYLLAFCIVVSSTLSCILFCILVRDLINWIVNGNK
jgi:hypothetical protein